MGYRSDVHILFYIGNRRVKNPEGKLLETIPIGPFAPIKLWFDENFPKDEDIDMVEVGKGYIYVRYEGVKWYESYEDVKAVSNAIESFDKCFNTGDFDHMTGMWEMVRLGENDDDLERSGSPHHDWRLQVRREVVLD
jgi:hypothetical protein